MSPTFAEVASVDAFTNAELRAIARHSTRGAHTAWYRVDNDGLEVAFVAIERIGERLVPLQLVVPRELRGRGIGSAVLRTVEELARSEECASVRVWPRPLDTGLDLGSLERWYRKRGYRPVPGGAGDLEKRVASGAPKQIERLAS